MSPAPRKCFRHPPRRALPGLLAAALLAALAVVAAVPAGGAMFNIHLWTDSTPDFADLPSFIRTAAGVWTTPQDSAIALWRTACRSKHQADPTFEDGRGLWDPILFLNSYSNLNCGYISSMLQSMWDASGANWRSTYVELDGHTVCEASWDAGATWHMFDASTNVYCLDHAGQVASADEIASASSCPLSRKLGAGGEEPGHFFLYHAAPGASTNPVDPGEPGILDSWGYRSGSDNPVGNTRTLRNGAQPYLDGYSRQVLYSHARYGWRYRLNVRPYESYTRYWRSLGDTPDFFRADMDGRNPDLWDDAHVDCSAFRGNGEWVFTPDLSSAGYRLSLHSESGVALRGESGGGPAIQPAQAGVAGQVTFKVYPANVVTSAEVDWAGVRGSEADTLEMSVSRDAGIHWIRVAEAAAAGAFSQRVALPAALVGGAYDFQVRVGMLAGASPRECGLDSLRIRTITQVNPRTLPRLARGNNVVRMETGDQAESEALWPALAPGAGSAGFRGSAESWENAAADSVPDVFYTATVKPSLAASPAHVTWHFTAPRDITGLEYGGNFFDTFGGSGDFVSLQHSFDGAAYTEDARYAGGGAQVNGRLFAAVPNVAGGRRDAWLRYAMMSRVDSGDAGTGIQDALMYVNYLPSDPRPSRMEVTYCWTEHRAGGDVTRRHTRLTGVPGDTWEIHVGGFRDPTMNWVRVNLPGYGPDGPVAEGYSDGEDVGSAPARARKQYLYDLTDNVALGRSYTVDRPADEFNGDEDGRELTNGCIIPPTDYADGFFVHRQSALWAGGEDLHLTLDLGDTSTVAAVRVSTHQPDGSWCHPESILVESALPETQYSPLGVIRHPDIWDPPGDELDWELVDSPKYADLPAGGLLAHSFWLAPPAPVTARYLRLTFTPQAGHGMGLSEIQVFRKIEVRDWPEREVLVGNRPGLVSVGPPAGGPPARLRLRPGAPSPFSHGTLISYELPRAGRVGLCVFGLRGERRRTLVDGFRPAGPGEVRWDGRDDAGRDLPSGVYFVRIEAGGSQSTRKILKVR